MLKTSGSTESVANPEKTQGEVGSDSVVGNIVSGGEVINPTKRKNQAKTTKSKILVKSKNHDFLKSKTEEARTGFFTPKARLAFSQLRQAFREATILNYFNLENHIQMETDASGYANGNVLCQLLSGTRPDGVVTKANLG